MKKSTLVRSDKPHAVKMAEGTNVAQRKNPKKNSAPDVDDTKSNIQKLPPVEIAQPAPIAVPTATAKPVRTKARTKAPTSEPVRAKPPARQATATPKATKPKATAKPRTKAQPEKPAEPIWEQDNPIKRRIEELKTRNAQLAEQIQRLSPTARGPRP